MRGMRSESTKWKTCTGVWGPLRQIYWDQEPHRDLRQFGPKLSCVANGQRARAPTGYAGRPTTTYPAAEAMAQPEPDDELRRELSELRARVDELTRSAEAASATPRATGCCSST